MLVLLPTSNSKLLAKWQRPYVIMARKGPVAYEVDMGRGGSGAEHMQLGMRRERQVCG